MAHITKNYGKVNEGAKVAVCGRFKSRNADLKIYCEMVMMWQPGIIGWMKACRTELGPCA